MLTIDRPERRNAVDLDTVTALGDHLEAPRAPRPGWWCSPAPAATSAPAPTSAASTTTSSWPRLNRTLVLLRDPAFVTIAAIDGVALGAGMQFAVSCDLRVATPDGPLRRAGGQARPRRRPRDRAAPRRLRRRGHGPGDAARRRGVSTATPPTALGLVQRLGDLDDALAWASDIAGLAPLTIAAHKLGLERTAERAERPGLRRGPPAGLALRRPAGGPRRLQGTPPATVRGE